MNANDSVTPCRAASQGDIVDPISLAPREDLVDDRNRIGSITVVHRIDISPDSDALALISSAHAKITTCNERPTCPDLLTPSARSASCSSHRLDGELSARRGTIGSTVPSLDGATQSCPSPSLSAPCRLRCNGRRRTRSPRSPQRKCQRRRVSRRVLCPRETSR